MTSSARPDLDLIVDKARAFFQSQVTYDARFRKERLEAFRQGLRNHERSFYQALHEDLHKPEAEAYFTEIGAAHWECRHALRHLHEWVKATPTPASLLVWPARARRLPEPRGTALIVAPWNYPLALTLLPLVGAIAAGCNAVIKPSEMAPATSVALSEFVSSTFGDDGYVSVVHGEAETSRQLLEYPWDLIFFTGSTRVGSLVMAAAARRLTPVVLELGGKSPVIVDQHADLELAARRIAWGKFANAGQTCVAPDYVLAHRSIGPALLTELSKAILAFYGSEPMHSQDYGRIVNQTHFDRLQALMAGGRVVHGGATDRAARFIAPTVLSEVDLDHTLMQEEIFGPLLPVIDVESVEQAIEFVRRRPKPLALYLFSKNTTTQKKVIEQTSSGGVAINDVMTHLVPTDLPFGGVGSSGMGAYHGKASFDAFTHYKSVLEKSQRFDFRFRYPPYPKLPAWLRKC